MMEERIGGLKKSAWETEGTEKSEALSNARRVWLRGSDLNRRPLGYEPNELPDCSTPRQCNLILLPTPASPVKPHDDLMRKAPTVANSELTKQTAAGEARSVYPGFLFVWHLCAAVMKSHVGESLPLNPRGRPSRPSLQ